MIFPRVHFKDFMIKGAPSGTLGLAVQSGWMNSEVFPLALKHFIKHIGCSKDNPAILFMDNHESHLSLEVIDAARDHGLSIITFPPHTSHKLQPLDVSVYGPLKTHYKKAVNEWNLSNPGKRITIYDLPECFTKAYYRALSTENISAGFKKTGLWPINSEIFSEDDFLAASVFRNDENTSSSHSCDINIGERELNPSDEPVMNHDLSQQHQTSFEELVDLRPIPKRKLTNLSTRKVCKRKSVGTKLITSTPEKEEAMRREKEKLLKQKNLPITEESSDETGDEDMSLHGESSEYEEDFDEDLAEQSRKEPESGDFVLVKFKPVNSKNKWLFYVGQIGDKFTDNDEKCYEVDFYRQSKKCPGKFIKPPCEDKAKVMRSDILMCLPNPVSSGGTKRMQSMIHFNVDLEQYKCQ